ncbi:MarR family transcriptional regulator [Stenotrophomonas sp. 24(2023)]|uniref:MarR family winged helix-turn-helix transcriptional regulator n=1 Tax=Stenotrophomonas sp. 24(2023) TaxID=3068324 RepID=UPI0027E1A40F|nr:MarR family transcriptional regulator [Stenotrophomonas sp. 24(2023)]WMJ68962.1 MarR family transcriptional regulator [Stenotrophomonas sp. 24(2023)]
MQMSNEQGLGEDAQVLRSVAQVFRGFAKLVDAPLRAVGVAYSQVPVLAALKDGGALTQAELVRRSQVEQSSMAQLLARMERDGLIVRTPDPADARSRQVVLSPVGRKKLPPSRGIMAAASARALDGFSADECAQLRHWLARIEANVQRALADDGQAPGQP